MNGQADLNLPSNFIGSYRTRRVKNAGNRWMSSASLTRTRAHLVLKNSNLANKTIPRKRVPRDLSWQMITEIGRQQTKYIGRKQIHPETKPVFGDEPHHFELERRERRERTEKADTDTEHERLVNTRPV